MLLGNLCLLSSSLADLGAHASAKKRFLTVPGKACCRRRWLSSQHHEWWRNLVLSLWSGNKTTESGMASYNIVKEEAENSKATGAAFWNAEGCILVAFFVTRENHQCCTVATLASSCNVWHVEEGTGLSRERIRHCSTVQRIQKNGWAPSLHSTYNLDLAFGLPSVRIRKGSDLRPALCDPRGNPGSWSPLFTRFWNGILPQGNLQKSIERNGFVFFLKRGEYRAQISLM